MPVLKNARRELFAQLLFQGFTAVDAYEKAGFKRHRGNACTLANNPEVQTRLEQIRAEAAALAPVGTSAIAAKAKVTANSLIAEADQVLAGAMSSRQYGAANGAIKNKGILSGVWVERAEVGGVGEFDHLTDAELDDLIRERYARLFGETPLAISDGSINGAVTDLKDRDD
jgi:hypothetical protein